MACDVVSVRLHLPQIRVLEVLEDTAARLAASVESTLRRLRCPHCGFRCHRLQQPSPHKSYSSKIYEIILRMIEK